MPHCSVLKFIYMHISTKFYQLHIASIYAVHYAHVYYHYIKFPS